jgi:hypothetical protein
MIVNVITCGFPAPGSQKQTRYFIVKGARGLTDPGAAAGSVSSVIRHAHTIASTMHFNHTGNTTSALTFLEQTVFKIKYLPIFHCNRYVVFIKLSRNKQLSP